MSSGMSMRLLSKGLLAGGFISGIYGLTEPNETATRLALALIVTGVLVAAYGMIRRLLNSRSES